MVWTGTGLGGCGRFAMNICPCDAFSYRHVRTYVGKIIDAIYLHSDVEKSLPCHNFPIILWGEGMGERRESNKNKGRRGGLVS